MGMQGEWLHKKSSVKLESTGEEKQTKMYKDEWRPEQKPSCPKATGEWKYKLKVCTVKR